MYILLNGKEIKAESSNTSGVLAQKKSGRKGEVNKVKQATKKPKSEEKSYANNPSVSNNKNISPTLHIDLQIHISSDATSEQIDCIFASIEKHLYSNKS